MEQRAKKLIVQLRSQLQATQQKLDPFILGISSAASVGAVLVILFGIFSFNIWKTKHY
ncbi:hypothetical protein [Nostoc sp. KVJ20]|uniref:hypothetical protein n=1 Tax=Nostoc sp. KVJ20 TaxID=457944 RepID=UPI00159F2A53|nr:hypothetical protein [Nostoc sp. KVJ20]